MKPQPTTRQGAEILTLRCAVCKDATVSAYDPATLHSLLKVFNWAWLNDNAICHRCLISDDLKVARSIRALQGDYIKESAG